jgi:hypothetical protein
MTLRDLALLFERQSVPKDLYCLTGGLPNEAYTIERAGDTWRVYYSERGQRTGVREFASEVDACELLAGWVLRVASGNTPEAEPAEHAP